MSLIEICRAQKTVFVLETIRLVSDFGDNLHSVMQVRNILPVIIFKHTIYLFSR